MYEGRTRGKRMKYTYSDEEDEGYSDATTSRRSTRNTGTHTPVEGPTVTQSGRQVKARHGGAYGESILSETTHNLAATNDYEGTTDDQGDENSTGRPRRAAATTSITSRGPKGGRHIDGYNNVDEMTSDDEDDASEQDYGDDEDDDDAVSLASDNDEPDDGTDEDEEMNDDLADDGIKKSLLVKLPIKTPTPEKKTIIKFRVSPEKERAPKDAGMMADEGARRDSSPSGAARKTEATTQPLASSTTEPSALSDDSSKPTSIPPRSPPTASTALSPRSPLAFRGSPEKPTAFPPPINVGYGGA